MIKNSEKIAKNSDRMHERENIYVALLVII